MSRIGLNYSVTFGTLLGLMRSDRLKPWTGDMDYLIHSTKSVANAMVHLWDTKKTGMAHIFQWINRMCLTQDVADGKLAKFDVTMPNLKSHKQVWKGGYPYLDFYVGKYHCKFPDEFDAGIKNQTSFQPKRLSFITILSLSMHTCESRDNFEDVLWNQLENSTTRSQSTWK